MLSSSFARVVVGIPVVPAERTHVPATAIHRRQLQLISDYRSLYRGGVGRDSGVGRGRGVALGVALGVGVGIGVAVAFGVGVGVGVGVAVAVGVGEGV
jgi:hypothetical protein